jgi:CRP/FNR family transcriptional regulator
VTTDIKTGTAPPRRADAVIGSRPQDADPVFGALARQACKLRVGRGQDVPFTVAGREAAFIVRSGALMLDVTLPDTSRQVVALLLPGDVLRSSFVPPRANARLCSAGVTEAWRVSWSELKGLADGNPALAQFVETAVASQMSRHALHAATIGRFSGEQRVATVLTELALRTGSPTTAGSLSFDMPFRRRDIADYLALNPDTLSRVISRLRKLGILGHSKRSKIVVRDARSLAALSPAARSLAEIQGDAGWQAPIQAG